MTIQIILAQELIDKIILSTPTDTMIKSRSVLSDYAYRLSMDLGINLMLQFADIEGLEYNYTKVKEAENSIINRIIVYTELSKLHEVLHWAIVTKSFNFSILSLKVLFLKNESVRTQSILNFLHYSGYKFLSHHYNLALQWENTDTILFLKSKHIPFDSKVLTKETAFKKNAKLLRFMISNNFMNLVTIYNYVALTLDKKFIKKVTKFVPIHIHFVTKYLKKKNVSNLFIRWLLSYLLFTNINISVSETFILLSSVHTSEYTETLDEYYINGVSFN